MTTTYTTQGSVRGSCGHQHRTIEAADRCHTRDHRGCQSQGGYSDRSVIAVEDGVGRSLTEDELDQLYSLRD